MNYQKTIKLLLPLLVLIAMGTALSIRWWLSAHYPENIQELITQHPITHLGIIMDGNRRWAKMHGYKPWIGHKHGIEPVRTVTNFCLHYGIPYLTLYVFSLENFQRPEEEKSFLFDILAQDVAKNTFDEIAQKQVRVQFVGDRTRFPEKLKKLITDLEEQTALNTRLTLTLLFCYGGQQEIVAAAQSLCKQIIMNGETPNAITAQRFEQHLWTSNLPPVDLTIRTGYYQRLSNFMSYRAAYSDLYYPACHWPDLTEQHLIDAVRYYTQSAHNRGA